MKIEDHYGEIFKGLEEAASRGEEALLEAGVPKQWAKTLTELAKQAIKPKTVKIAVEIRLQCISGGIEAIKDVLTGWQQEITPPTNATIRVYTLGAPRYRLDIEASSYREAEKLLSEILSRIEKKAQKQACTLAHKRVATD